MIGHSHKDPYRALVLAPHGRDAALAAQLLSEARVDSLICEDLVAFEKALGDHACLAVVTEDSIRSADLRHVSAWVDAQPAWSDLPFIILTRHGGGPEKNPAAARLLDVFGNVTFVERPFHPTTFLSVARTALKGRQRQYEARASIDAMRESEDRLRTALLAGRLGSWELDIETQTLTVSATCKAVFGRAAGEPFDYDILLASIHPDDRQRMQDSVRTSIESGADYAIEYRNIWPDGSVHWADVRARIARDGSGGKRRLLGVSSDITERKTGEDNLRRLNETLEQRVSERTAELEAAHEAVLKQIAQRERAEEQLRQAQKMETIGQITGGVAHDFNNLLMAVLGNLDLLRRHVPDDPKTARLIDGALKGAQRGAALTQRLLAFARRQELKVEPCNLTDLVAGMTDLLERSVGPQIELTFAFSENLPLTLVDSNQVELALLNLVVNARDAMPGGGVISIAIDVAEATGSDLKPGPHVRLTVTDAGHGMDAQTLKKAAEPFFSTKELGKGTGLGLSMIQGLALQLGGALRLESKVGVGTRAELWFPATSAAADRSVVAAAVAPSSAQTTHTATILVVDDDALIAMSTVDMLEDLGHEVIEANSGEAALKVLRNGKPIDLMITDYSMPQMTGVQLAEMARELHPDLPILLATGYAELGSGTVLRLPRLAKPYQQHQLANEIAKILK